MAALPYMQFYVADYLADTAHLTAEEHGAYMLLLFNYWQTGKALPKQRLHRIARIPADQWPEIESVLSEFFEDNGEAWIHLRVERDMEAVLTSPRGKKLPGGDSLSGYKGYVYFVTDASSDIVKIGYSKNPWARLSELRRSHGDNLSVVATVKTVEKSESSIHASLSEFRKEGEWFWKSNCISGLISSIANGKTSTVADICTYVASYVGAATATTNTDTDTEEHNTLRAEPEKSADPKAPCEMTLDWVPDQNLLKAYALRMAIPVDRFTPEATATFVCHYSASGRCETQAAWVSLLVKWVKRDEAVASNVRQFPQKRQTSEPDFDSTEWATGLVVSP